MGCLLMDQSVLSERFRVFAERECKDSSALYGYLAENIANDPKLLQLAAHSSQGQPVPNLLLGAVHYLLLKGIDHDLTQYYASLVSEPRKPRESSAAINYFRDFCKQYENEIIKF
jgi:hypothetical protein